MTFKIFRSVLLGIKPRALHLLRKHSTTELYSQPIACVCVCVCILFLETSFLCVTLSVLSDLSLESWDQPWQSFSCPPE